MNRKHIRNGFEIVYRKDSKTGRIRPMKILFRNGQEIEHHWIDDTGLFQEPKYRKYSDIVSFSNEEQARNSTNILSNEFEKAKTREKKLRIARVTQYAANRALASSKRTNISQEEIKKLKIINELYDNKAKEMWSQYSTI